MITLKNAFLTVKFSENNGNICSLYNNKTGQEFIGENNETAGAVWEIEFKDSHNRSVRINNKACPAFSFTRAGNNALSLRFVWKTAVAGKEITVSSAVRLPAGSCLSYWRLDIENRSDYRLWSVDFPVISGIKALSKNKDEDYLILPYWIGLLINNPFKTIFNRPSKYHDHNHAFQGSYPGSCTMQFSGYYNKTGGIYFAAYDDQGRFKRFRYYGGKSKNDFTYKLINFPKNMGLIKNYSMPYEAVLGVFQGDWLDCAKLYKQWAVNQKWCRKGKIKSRSDIPAWLKANSFWGFNWMHNDRGSPEEIARSAVKLKEIIQAPLTLHWYGWNDVPFAYYPYVVPPRTAKKRAQLREALQKLHRVGIKAIPYIDTRQCYPAGLQKDGGVKECLAADAAGKLYRSAFSLFAPYSDKKKLFRPFSFCPAAARTKNIHFKPAKKVFADFDFDGAYLDEVAIAGPLLCFNDRHGHPRGGGNYWCAGNRDMSAKIIGELRKKRKERIFASEGSTETYLDLFHIFLILEFCHERLPTFKNLWRDKWEHVPLFTAVYHEYAITYGGHSFFNRGYTGQFIMELARYLCYGCQPMLEGYYAEYLEDEEFKTEVDFVKEVAEKYDLAREYLLYGELLGIPATAAPAITVKCESRRDLEVRGKKERDFIRKIQPVLCSLWKGGDRSIGLIAVNISGRARKLKFVFAAEKYSFKSDKCRLCELVGINQERFVANKNAPFFIEEDIPARKARVFKITPYRNFKVIPRMARI